jgi:CRP-like cAMP-binding protein
LVVLCDRLRKTSIALEEIALFDVEARLARLLVKLAEEYGRPHEGGIRITLKLSQTDLATQIAASREGVNRQMRSWKVKGVVGTQAGHLVLHDVAALRELVAG